MSRIAAFFDVDGTLFKANAINHYLGLTRQNIPQWHYWWKLCMLAVKVPYYLFLDHIDRQRFNKAFYLGYRNYSQSQLQSISKVYCQEKLITCLFPAATDCINQHQKQGDLLILVTGSLDFIVAPLAEFLNAEAIVATSLYVQNGLYTGEIQEISPIGEEKAQAIRRIARDLEIDLSKSYAYGDSKSDLPMLYAVENPVAINPDSTLKQIANQENWTIKYWN